MDDVKSLIEIIIGFFSILTTVFGAIWFLISHWSKQQQKIKKLEGTIVESQLEKLTTQVETHSRALQVNNHETSKAREEIVKANGRLEVTNTKLEATTEKIADFSEDTKRRILEIEYTMANGELISVGKGAVMIRGRKKD